MRSPPNYRHRLPRQVDKLKLEFSAVTTFNRYTNGVFLPRNSGEHTVLYPVHLSSRTCRACTRESNSHTSTTWRHTLSYSPRRKALLVGEQVGLKRPAHKSGKGARVSLICNYAANSAHFKPLVQICLGRYFHVQRLVRASVVVIADPVANNAAGVFQGLEPVSESCRTTCRSRFHGAAP